MLKNIMRLINNSKNKLNSKHDILIEKNTPKISKIYFFPSLTIKL